MKILLNKTAIFEFEEEFEQESSAHYYDIIFRARRVGNNNWKRQYMFTIWNSARQKRFEFDDCFNNFEMKIFFMNSEFADDLLP